MYSGVSPKILQRFFLFFLTVLLFVSCCLPSVYALAPEQKKILNEGIYYYNVDTCDSGTSGVAPGDGAPEGAQFPKLDPQAMADSINKFIKKQSPRSPLAGLGSTIVASAQKAQVNPFLVPAIALQETSLGDAKTPQVTQGNNLFNRGATSSQPSITASGRQWYKWSSVKASVDSTAPENQHATGGGDFLSYLRNQYANSIDSSDLTALFLEYAPPADSNDTAQYVANVKGWIDEMVKGAGSATSPAQSAPSGCCPGGGSSSAGGATTDGTNSAGNEYNFLVNKGLSPQTAAAITGNNIWESGGSLTELTLVPTSVNSIGATGIAQWYAGRATKLHEFAQQQGKPWDDLGLQLDYLWSELKGPYSGALKDAAAQPNIELAVTTFEKEFEVSGDTGSYPERISAAKAVLQKFGGGGVTTSTGATGGCAGSGSSTVGTYKNPFRKVKNLRPERIDMGVDYAGEGPVYALGPGIVKNLRNPGWNYGGYDAFISVELTDGPAKGKYSYMAEACVPVNGLHVGQKVDANTVICKMINPTSTGIETGWAAPPGLGDTMATSNGGYTEGYATKMGENYNQLLVKLGVPSGVQQPQMGSLPANWPTW